MKRIIIFISFIVAALVTILRPFFLKEWMNNAEPIHFIVLFYCCSLIFLFWVGISSAFQFSAERGWGCLAGFFAIYFGFIFSPIIALFQLISGRFSFSFRKFLIIVIISVLLLLVIFNPILFREFWMSDNLSFGNSALAFIFTSTIGLFWVGAPAGWNFADYLGFGIIGKCFLAYFALFLSLPIALIQLFIPNDT